MRSGGGAKGGGRGVGGGATRKRKYAPNEQGRYVCAQCSRSYAAYHVTYLLFQLLKAQIDN